MGIDTIEVQRARDFHRRLIQNPRFRETRRSHSLFIGGGYSEGAIFCLLHLPPHVSATGPKENRGNLSYVLVAAKSLGCVVGPSLPENV